MLNNYLNIKKLFTSKVLVLLTFCAVDAQEITITYDYASVEKLLEIFDRGQLGEKDFQKLIELNGTQAYLKKLATFFPNVNELGYKKSLKAALNGNYMDDDPYMLKRLVTLLPDSKRLLEKVIKGKQDLTQSSVSKLKKYTPKDTKINATVYLTLGVIGGGWTFDDDPNSFYVDFSSMKGDYLGLSYLSTHELYHLVQYRFMKQIDKKNKVNYLLDQMLREGSAAYVADFSKIEATGSYVDFSKKEYQINFKRLKTNFVLFENLLFQSKFDKDVDLDSLYNIGYSGMYQSPLYYVGYHIIKLVEQYKGKQELLSLLNQSPKELLLVYIELCDIHNDNKDFISLSKATIEILTSM